MQTSPKFAIALNVVYATLVAMTTPALAAAGVAHPEQVAAWAGLAAVPLNAFLHAISSDAPGPLARGQSDGAPGAPQS